MSVYIPNNVLELFSHTLSAPRVPDIGTREPILSVGFKINKDKPQYSQAFIKVAHFIRGEEKNKAFEAKTSITYVLAALQQLIAYSNKPFDGKKEIMSWSIKGPKIVNGKMSKERIVNSKIVVGRTEKGPFISVVHWNTKYPHIAFYPGVHDDMNVANEATDSVERTYEFVCANAKGWAQTIIDTLVPLYNEEMKHALRKMKQDGGGNNGGGNRDSDRSYGSSNSYSNDDYSSDNTTSQDEDVDYGDFNF